MMDISFAQTYIGDWTCVDLDTYDGAPDGNNWYGSGSTKMEALTDYFQHIYEEEELPDDETLKYLLDNLWRLT